MNKDELLLLILFLITIAIDYLTEFIEGVKQHERQKA